MPMPNLVIEIGFDGVSEDVKFAVWLCDLMEDMFGIVSEPINVHVVDEDSRRHTVYYGSAGNGMPIGWILPGYDTFMFGRIFMAVLSIAKTEGDDNHEFDYEPD